MHTKDIPMFQVFKPVLVAAGPVFVRAGAAAWGHAVTGAVVVSASTCIYMIGRETVRLSEHVGVALGDALEAKVNRLRMRKQDRAQAKIAADNKRVDDKIEQLVALKVIVPAAVLDAEIDAEIQRRIDAGLLRAAVPPSPATGSSIPPYAA